MREGLRQRTSRATALFALTSCVTCATLMSCSSSEPPVAAQSPAYSTTLPPVSPNTASERGRIVSSTTDTIFDSRDLPEGTTTASFVYSSTSGVDGGSTEVTGALFVPPGPAPSGGRPVVAYAHGTVGISHGCAPTESFVLSGDAAAVSFLLQQGYAVTYTDYQGLSSTTDSPPHPYLEPRTSGVNVIDSVRAARNLDPTLSTRWVAVGTSQGGQAAWATSELNQVYGDGLELLGAATLAPALDVSPIVADAQASTLSGGQRSLYPLIVAGLAAVDPSIVVSDHLHGILGENIDALLACNAESAEVQNAAAADVQPGDTTASSAAAADLLTSRLQEYSLPRAGTTVPILAVYGGVDDIVRPAWTEGALAEACALGDTILKVRIEDQGHSIDPGTLLETWIADRFNGVPAPNNC